MSSTHSFPADAGPIGAGPSGTGQAGARYEHVDSLRQQLGQLQTRRQWHRLLSAAAQLVTIIAASLIAVYVLDRGLHLVVIARAAVLLLATAAVISLARRYALPAIGVRESIADVAVLVEGRSGIDTDLVATLQFSEQLHGAPGAKPVTTITATTAGTATTGVPAGAATHVMPAQITTGLQRAVIAGTLSRPPSGQAMLEPISKPVARRLQFAAAILVGLSLFTIVAPREVGVFLQRLLLSSVKYPTSTSITAVRINQTDVSPSGNGFQPVTIAAGTPVEMQVSIAGVRPENARLTLRDSTGNNSIVLLAPVPAAESDTNPAMVFTVQLPALNQSLQYAVRAGDDDRDLSQINVVPLPEVGLTYDVRLPADMSVPPEYTPPVPGRRIVTVPGDSAVSLQFQSQHSSIKQATVIVGEQKLSAVRDSEDGRTWKLPAAGTPFASVIEPVAFTVEIIDEHGLRPATELVGEVRLLADAAPRVAAAAVTRRIISTATPVISYAAADDRGLGSVMLQYRIVSANGGAPRTGTRSLFKKSGERQPTLKGQYKLPVSELSTTVGDRVELNLLAVDDRGRLPGKSSESETLLFEVTDAAGVLAGLLASDKLTEQQLDEMIARQLGIGATE